MNKTLKYIVSLAAVLLLLFFSLDIQKLDVHKAETSIESFNARSYAQTFWEKDLPQCINNAKDLSELMVLLQNDPEKAFDDFGHKLGISKTHYFFVKDIGRISRIDTEYLLLNLENNTSVMLATDFIFGNAVRDGSGKVDINQFVNMTDFNEVSVALNKMVKQKIVAPLKDKAQIGRLVDFAGAIEVNEENMDLKHIRVIPVSINISKDDAE